MHKALVLVLLFSSTLLASLEFPAIPDDEQTWGTLCTTSDRDFKEYRYREQIPYCKRRVSSSRKRKIYENYGVPSDCRSQYTIDHYIPLSIGGTNKDNNLWPEHKLVKALRAQLELETFEDLRDGIISQDEAVTLIIQEKQNPILKGLDPETLCH